MDSGSGFARSVAFNLQLSCGGRVGATLPVPMDTVRPIHHVIGAILQFPLLNPLEAQKRSPPDSAEAVIELEAGPDGPAAR